MHAPCSMATSLTTVRATGMDSRSARLLLWSAVWRIGHRLSLLAVVSIAV
jgi:hypothetical protein